jgi:hypothetical protein
MLTPVQFRKKNNKMEKDKMHEAYQRYLQTQCSYWAPGQNQYLAGEIVSQWSRREDVRRAMITQQAEMLKIDGVLSGLLYEMKRKLCRLGRNGGWSAWLEQQKISRATADRLVLEHAEYFDLTDELPHREPVEPLEGRICQSAYRTSDRLKNFLRSPKARMDFVKVLANKFDLAVEYGEADTVRLSIPPPEDAASINYTVPNVIQITPDGSVQPVNYELRDEEGDVPL